MNGSAPLLAAVPLALLAGGAGTRVQSVSPILPKALFEVNGRPFIAHQLELVRRQGVRRVVICVGHLGDQMEAYVGDGRRFDLDVSYSRDGKTLLGTAGALRKAAAALGSLFWVMYGDTYLDVNFAEVLSAFRGSPALGLMTVFRNDNRFDRSNVALRGGTLTAYDKRRPAADMTHIDYGLSLLRDRALAGVPEGVPADLGDVYQELVGRGAMDAYEVRQRFYEIGSPEGLAETRRFLAQ